MRAWRVVVAQAIDAMVQELTARVPRLKHVHNRSDAMIGVYDGHGARFQRHIDNTARDGRRLTVLCYLNPGWKMEDGGALEIYPTDDGASVAASTTTSVPPATATADDDAATTATTTTAGSGAPEPQLKAVTGTAGVGRGGGGEGGGGGAAVADAATVTGTQIEGDGEAHGGSATAPAAAAAVAATSSGAGAGGGRVDPQTHVTAYPLAGRVAMFWSEKVPHAVLPTFAPRYALTVWYYDSEERRESILAAKADQTISKGRKTATPANRKAVRTCVARGCGRCRQRYQQQRGQRVRVRVCVRTVFVL